MFGSLGESVVAVRFLMTSLVLTARLGIASYTVIGRRIYFML